MNFKRYVESSDTWHDTPHYIHNTSTDTITTPADIYANDNNATVGLKGDMSQTGTPSPTTPIQPSECGERTGNLFDKDNTTGIIANTFINQSGAQISNSDYYISAPINIEAEETYTWSFSSTSTSRHTSPTVGFYDENNSLIGVASHNNSVYNFAFTTPSGCKYIRASVYTANSNYTSMLVKGDVSREQINLPFIPYGIKIPILSANTTTPVYLGEVQSTRRVKKLMLTGEESWDVTSGNAPYFLRLSDIVQTSDRDIILYMSTHYLAVSYNASWSQYNACVSWQLSGGVKGLVFRDTNQTTLSDFKAYLAQQYAAGTPVTVWYVLTTPQTAIVNEPIRKIGDYADEVSGITIPTIAGANTLSVDTTLQPSEVSVNYKGWHKASEIVHRYQYGEWDGSPSPTYPVYGFKIDKNNDDPDTRVTYLYDAEGMTPAYMDFSNGTFNYGSWANAWFIKNNRPVALKFDGTVDYELNHTDFTKKLDGTASDVEDSSYNGNFMSEMPTVYVKRWEDNDYNYMAFCEIPYDEDFLAQAHTNANGDINDYIYLPMFKGSLDANYKLRSLMGTIPNGDTSGHDEVSFAGNCGTGWQIWDKAKIDLVMDLIVLITKSTNCRAKIGNGDCQTYNESDTRKDSKNNGANGKMMSGYEVGDSTRSANAQFYGTEGTDSTGYGTHHMIAFYIEDLWANRWDRCLGFNLVNNVYKVKMTPPYVLNSDSTYQTLDIAPPSSTEGWLKNVSSGVYGDIPTAVGATNTTGFASYFLKNVGGNRLSLFGGFANAGLKAGRRWEFGYDSSSSTWNIGGSLCYNSPT